MKNRLGNLGVVVFAIVRDNVVKIRGRWRMGMARRDKGIGGGTSRVREGMGGGLGRGGGRLAERERGEAVEWRRHGWMGGVDKDIVK